MYILAVLSKAPATGYDVMQSIEERTEGAWRPGPGTIYPLLKELMREGLLKTGPRRPGSARVVYSVTPSGGAELGFMRAKMASFGGRDRGFMRLVLDLVPIETLVPMLLSRARDGSGFLKSAIESMPEPDRTASLRELEALAQNLLDWVSAALEAKAGGTHRRGAR
jgi:DNA-binding PadR family transcriptional regulator